MILLYWILNNGYLAYAVSDDCKLEWNYIYESQTNQSISRVYNDMYQYSGLTINELGKYYLCNEIPTARFVLFSVSSSPQVFKTICGPLICSKEDYLELGTQLFGAIGFSVVYPHKYQVDHYSKLTNSAIASISICVLLLLLSIIATLLRYLFKENKRFNLMKYVLIFDIKHNLKSLLSVRENKIKNFEVFDGLRALSIIYVVIGHVHVYYQYAAPLNNLDWLSDFMKSPVNAFWMGGLFAVDTFFWLSGFFVAYYNLIIIQSNKLSFSTVMLIYINRLLRILPVYAFVLLTNWSLLPYFGSGPIWSDVDERLNGDCSSYWYTNFLFLNNFLPDGKYNLCHGQSWYLAVDMQLFISMPLVLIIYEKLSYYIGWILILLFQVSGIVATAAVVIKYNLKVVPISTENSVYENGESFSLYQAYYYEKPVCRIAAYFIGVACGMAIFSVRNKELGKKHDSYLAFFKDFYEIEVARYVSFVFGSVLMIALMILQYDQFMHPDAEYKYSYWGDEGNCIFLIFHRLLFAIGISLVVIPLVFGYFPVLIRFFSLNIWTVISKISFTVYLVHLQLIVAVYSSSKSSTDLNFYILARDSFLFVVLSVVVSVPIYLLVEIPAANCVKLILGKGSSEEKNKEDESSKTKLLEDT